MASLTVLFKTHAQCWCTQEVEQQSVVIHVVKRIQTQKGVLMSTLL